MKELLVVPQIDQFDTFKEFAEAFSLSENTVSVRLSRIRTQLKTYLIKEGFFL